MSLNTSTAVVVDKSPDGEFLRIDFNMRYDMAVLVLINQISLLCVYLVLSSMTGMWLNIGVAMTPNISEANAIQHFNLVKIYQIDVFKAFGNIVYICIILGTCMYFHVLLLFVMVSFHFVSVCGVNDFPARRHLKGKTRKKRMGICKFHRKKENAHFPLEKLPRIIQVFTDFLEPSLYDKCENQFA